MFSVYLLHLVMNFVTFCSSFLPLSSSNFLFVSIPFLPFHSNSIFPFFSIMSSSNSNSVAAFLQSLLVADYGKQIKQADLQRNVVVFLFFDIVGAD